MTVVTPPSAAAPSVILKHVMSNRKQQQDVVSSKAEVIPTSKAEVNSGATATGEPRECGRRLVAQNISDADHNQICFWFHTVGCCAAFAWLGALGFELKGEAKYTRSGWPSKEVLPDAALCCSA